LVGSIPWSVVIISRSSSRSARKIDPAVAIIIGRNEPVAGDPEFVPDNSPLLLVLNVKRRFDADDESIAVELLIRPKARPSERAPPF
jgi:hypothetical protein